MNNNDFDNTMKFEAQKEKEFNAREILEVVYEALIEKGYNPTDQIIGYILSGDPTYITSNKEARTLIRKMERDELLEEILNHYMKDFK